MGKLRDRDMHNIVRNRKQKKKSIARLAEHYGVTKRRIHPILSYEAKYGVAPIVHNRGRKMKKITEKEEELIVCYFLLTRLGIYPQLQSMRKISSKHVINEQERE